MKPFLTSKLYYPDLSYLRSYLKQKDGKKYSGVSVDDEYFEYYTYPYDLAWKLGLENLASIPPILKIEDGKTTSQIKLREHQEPLVSELEKEPRGLLVSKPGTGKTVMMLELVHRLQLKTLILVNTKFLLEQWEKECKKLLDYRPGIYGGGKKILKDITIGTFQTVTKDKTLNELKNKFSLVIVDEAHHCPARTFKYTLNNLAARYKLGVTGTRKRKDGLEFITSWCLSDKLIINKVDDTMKPKIVIVKTGIRLPEGENFVEVLTNLSYVDQLYGIIANLINKNPGRHQLILLQRLDAVDKLSAFFPNALVITGKEGSREDLNNRILQHKLIISTLLNEGVNIPNLDTLHLVHPNNNLPQLEQKIARINRPVEGKKTPLVLDYWYKKSKYPQGFNVTTQQKTRKEWYFKQGYDVYELTI